MRGDLDLVPHSEPHSGLCSGSVSRTATLARLSCLPGPADPGIRDGHSTSPVADEPFVLQQKLLGFTVQSNAVSGGRQLNGR